jgi:putative autoinducer-2 (AI-2) aldolase
MGRNIFRSEAPVAMIKAVRAIVHDKASVDEAFDVFNSEKVK